MKTMTYFIAAFAVMLTAPVTSWSFEFECGYRISGFSGNGCPYGEADSPGGCPCSNGDGDLAPRWYTGRLDMKVESQGGNGTSASTFTSLGASAAAMWSEVSGSSLLFNGSQTISATSSAPSWGAGDSQQIMYWVSNNNEWINETGSGAGGTLGVTIPVTQTFSCSDRRIVDGDILINGFVDYGWSEAGLFSTILHEMGHAIGLGHPCLTAQSYCSNSCVAVMAATAGDYPSLRQDDINAVSELYPGTPGGVGSACSSGSQCNSGICIEDDGISYCTQQCGTCPEGYVCETVSGGQQVCIREGLPGEGESCTDVCDGGLYCVEGSCYQACQPGSSNECSAGRTCVEVDPDNNVGLCFEIAGPYDECFAQGQCPADYICIGNGSTGICAKNCEVCDFDCPSNTNCVELQGGGGACMQAGAREVGERCSLASDCAGGLACVGGLSGYTCKEVCDTNNPSCPSGQSCQALNGSDCLGICTEASSGGGGTDSGGGTDTGGGGTDSGGGTDTGGSGSGGGSSGGTCSCDTTWSCDIDSQTGGQCACDLECGNNPVCSCDSTWSCDADSLGNICGCDPECISDGCVPTDGISKLTCDCDTTYSCDSNTCGRECGCDPECDSGCDTIGKQSDSLAPLLALLAVLGMLSLTGHRRRREA